MRARPRGSAKVSGKINWAVFVSGQGTNLQNVLELERESLSFSRVNLVLADRPCIALDRAKKFKKSTIIINPKLPDSARQMLKVLRKNKISAIFLLGYMRILRPDFLSQWNGPIVNLHPSVLPKFKGSHAIQAAIEAHEPTLGVSLHEVVEEVDSGKILRQLQFPRDSKWSLDEATKVVHTYERKIVSDFLMDLEEMPSFVQDYCR